MNLNTIFIALFLLLFNINIYSTPTNKTTDKFSLLTGGIGKGIEERFGHTILNEKVFYRNNSINWGMFSFKENNFALNFFLGKMRYWAGESSLEQVVYWHKNRHKFLIKETINLTIDQTNTLSEKIKHNLQDENKYFWYHYFKKNCSTIPRDHLNQILFGKVKEKFAAELSDKTYRYYVRKNLNFYPYVSFFLDIVMNSNIDYKITKWDEMFYPLKLREYLLDFPQVDDNKNIIPDTKLLSDTKILVDKTNDFGIGFNFNWLLLLLSFILVLVPFFLSKKFANIFYTKVTIFFCKMWFLLSGILGSIMMLAWIFSAHIDLHHNANLLLYWPTDFVILFLSTKYREKIKLYLLAHIGFAAVHGCAFLLDFIIQDVSWVVCYQSPIMIMTALILFYYLKRSDSLSY